VTLTEAICGITCCSEGTTIEVLIAGCVLTEGRSAVRDSGALTDSEEMPSTGVCSATATGDFVLIGEGSLSTSGGTPSGSGGPTKRSVKLGRHQSELGAMLSFSAAASFPSPVFAVK